MLAVQRVNHWLGAAAVCTHWIGAATLHAVQRCVAVGFCSGEQ
jgi:hypothetical protein